uniref:Uncharacterized protein n=1 Tax=Rhizophora mucronata TaxID=61149 RepID=A0A2P2QFY1_RHIMU
MSMVAKFCYMQCVKVVYVVNFIGDENQKHQNLMFYTSTYIEY